MLFDSPADLAPESVLNWLNLCATGLVREEHETYRLLNTALPLPQYLNDELAVGASPAEIATHFKLCRQELELAAVLTMIAAAEARIRLDATSRIESSADDLAKRLRFLRESVRLEWAVALYEDGIVDAWKSYIASLTALPDADRARLLTAIGSFKNLLNIRHWVAHGRYWRPKWGPERFHPADVADVINRLYDAFRQVASLHNLISFA